MDFSATWQDNICVRLSSRLGLTPPDLESLSGRLFEDKIATVLKRWALEYARNWPTHLAAFDKDHIFEKEVMEVLVNGVFSLEHEKSPIVRRRKCKEAKWLRYEYHRFPKGIANFGEKSEHTHAYFGSILTELDELRWADLELDYEQMSAKLVPPSPRLTKRLLERRDALFLNGSLLSHTLLNAMGLYHMGLSARLDQKGELVLVNERI